MADVNQRPVDLLSAKSELGRHFPNAREKGMPRPQESSTIIAAWRRLRAAIVVNGALLLAGAAVHAIAQTTPANTTRQVADRGQAAGEAWADRCQALRSFSWPQLVIQEVRLVPTGPGPAAPDGSAAAPAAPLPEHCLFIATLRPRTGAQGQHLGIEVRMPVKWNGRFAFEGGGGLDGVLRPSYGSVFGTIHPPALVRGFAVAERMPLAYDGVVAGDPTFHFTRINLGQTWNEVVLARAAP